MIRAVEAAGISEAPKEAPPEKPPAKAKGPGIRGPLEARAALTPLFGRTNLVSTVDVGSSISSTPISIFSDFRRLFFLLCFLFSRIPQKWEESRKTQCAAICFSLTHLFHPETRPL